MLPAEICAESCCATAPATPADICGSGSSGKTVLGPGAEGGNNPCCDPTCCDDPCCDRAGRERASVHPPKSARKIRHRPAFRPRRSELLRLLSKFELFLIGPALTSAAGKYSDLVSAAGIQPRYLVRTHPPGRYPVAMRSRRCPLSQCSLSLDDHRGKRTIKRHRRPQHPDRLTPKFVLISVSPT